MYAYTEVCKGTIFKKTLSLTHILQIKKTKNEPYSIKAVRLFHDHKPIFLKRDVREEFEKFFCAYVGHMGWPYRAIPMSHQRIASESTELMSLA